LLICHYDDIKYFSIGYASGLIYLYGNRGQARPVICNPITGRYAILPDRYTYRKAYSFFGFDPIDKQYKAFEGICINGVLYYLGDAYGWDNPHDVPPGNVIVCFDLRSENVTYIRVESSCQLINYKGKLAVTYWEKDFDSNTINEFHVWVLEDGEKHEWSKYAYTLSDDKFFRSQVSVAGMTASGEIVFSMRKYTSKQPFYVFYFNPERNNLRRVEIQGFGEAFKKTCSVCTFVNHVEDLNVNDLKQLKSVHPPLVQPEYVESDSESD
ncbi:unnamed protein product, partial [Arabidopsis halleri]